MKLMAFDFEYVLDGAENYDTKTMSDEVKEKLKPYVLYFRENDSIGICYNDQKKNIVEVLKEYGEVKLVGEFLNLYTFFNTEDYGWDNVILGNYELDADEIWSEFAKLLKKNEKLLIEAGDNFGDEWHKLEKEAIRSVFDKIIADIKKEIDDAEKDLEERVGMYR